MPGQVYIGMDFFFWGGEVYPLFIQIGSLAAKIREKFYRFYYGSDYHRWKDND
jgi:hypothetical protein